MRKMTTKPFTGNLWQPKSLGRELKKTSSYSLTESGCFDRKSKKLGKRLMRPKRRQRIYFHRGRGMWITSNPKGKECSRRIWRKCRSSR